MCLHPIAVDVNRDSFVRMKQNRDLVIKHYTECHKTFPIDQAVIEIKGSLTITSLDSLLHKALTQALKVAITNRFMSFMKDQRSREFDMLIGSTLTIINLIPVIVVLENLVEPISTDIKHRLLRY